MKLNPRVPVMREAIQKIVPMLTDRKIRVTSRGTTAFVEYNQKTLQPVSVNVPFMPDDASDELLDATQGFLDHEVGHILFTDSAVLKKAKELKVSNLHNIIEDPYVEKAMGQKFTGSNGNLQGMAHFFLREVTDKRLREVPDKKIGTLIVPIIRAWAGQSAYKDYMDKDDKWSLAADFLKAAGPDMPKMIESCASSEDCLNVAIELKKRMKAADIEAKKDKEKKEEKKEEKKKPPKAPPPEDKGEDDAPEPDEGEEGDPAPEGDPGDSDDEDKEDSDEGPASEGDPESSDDDASGDPEEGEGEGGKESLPGDDGDSDDDEEFRDSETHSTEDPEFDNEGKGEIAPPSEDDPSKEKDGEAPTSVAEFSAAEEEYEDTNPDHEPLYDALEDAKSFDEDISDALTKEATKGAEKSDYIVFTTDDDLIEPVPVAKSGATGKLVSDMVDSVDHMIGPMQKDLERAMAAITQTVWSPGHKSGRLHSAALVRGMFGRDDLFRRKEMSRSKDVAVELVVDCSGSMGGAGKIQIACHTAYALSSVLERIGIQNEVIGFTTKPLSASVRDAMIAERSKASVRYSRTEALYMPVFKGFGERLTSEVKRRFAEVPFGGAVSLRENVDGESIQVAARRLLARREARKVMIVLSDGHPSCSGDRAALDTHLIEAVKLLEKQKIEVVGLGIMDSSVKRYYPKSVVVNSVSDLPTEVMKQLKQFLIRR